MKWMYAFGIVSLALSPVAADVPPLINFQGRLLSGTNLVNGSVGLSLRFFTAPAGGSPQYEDSNSVTVVDGLYSTFIGDNTTSGSLAAALTNEEVWIEVAVDGMALAPRERLAASAFALRAGMVPAGGVVGTLSDGNLSTNVARLDLASQTFNGQVNFGNASNSFTGVFSGNGAAVTNVNYATMRFPPTFVRHDTPAVGDTPMSVAVSDVNGDGAPDLVTANQLDNTLSVLLNDGAGGFFLSSSPAVGSNPVSVAAADLNADGNVDLVCANANANTLSVLTNNGTGAFTLHASPSVGVMPNGVAVADVNGDGRPDLISANGGSGTLSVLTNKGGGFFTLSSSPPVGSGPSDVVANDINADGRIDLVAANLSGNSLSVLTNGGGGAFTAAATIPAGVNPCALAAADVNGDGKPDLVCANQGSGTLSILTNSGAGVFGLASSPSSGGPFSYPASVAVADIDGDGKVELLSTALFLSVSIFTNNGNGVFSAGVGFFAGSVRFVATSDVNADGRIDAIAGSWSPAQLSIFLNTPLLTGAFSGDGSLLTHITGYGIASGTIAAANLAAEVLTNISARLESEAWVVADSTTNHVRRSGDTMSGALTNRKSITAAQFLNSLNAVSGTNSVAVGGAGNSIAPTADYSSIGGGLGNTIQTNADWSFIGGGWNNSIQANTESAVLGGGFENSIQGFAAGAFIGGGEGNGIQFLAYDAVLAGGFQNRIESNAPYATIPGGRDNTVANGATNALAAGHRAKANHPGAFVWADNTDADFASTTANQFLIRASGGVGIGTGGPQSPVAMVRNVAGGRGAELSLVNGAAPALGSEAALNFAVEDSTYGGDLGNAQIKARLASTNDNRTDLIFSTWNGSAFGERLRIQSDGRIGVGVGSPTNLIHVAGGAQCNGTTWLNASDRNLKDNIAPVDAADLLARVARLPVYSWNYREANPGSKHVGPMAQDFHATFGLGDNDTTISTVDPAGVALAAIQALKSENDGMRRENAELKAALDALTERVRALEAR